MLFVVWRFFTILTRLPNTPLLNIWLNIKEENKKSGNVMQQTIHSYVCGINLRSESSLVLSDLHFS